ncbi:unnamed protein product [Leuciscus chuanchicus]
MNDHRTSLQNGHDVDISHKDNDNTTEPQQPLLTDTISAEPCPQSSPQTDILELLQDSAPKDDFLENSQGSQDSISQPPITPEQQPLSPDTFSLSPPTPLLCFSQKMEELVHAGTRLSHSFAASPQISTKKRRAPLPPKPAGPAHPPPASVRALRPLPQCQGPHPPPSARVSADAEQKLINCCRVVSRLTRAQFTDPIIGFRLQNKSPPCVKAVIFETERGEFCLDWRQQWVKDEVKLLRAQRNKSLTSTPPPASSISKLTPVGGSSQSTDRS